MSRFTISSLICGTKKQYMKSVYAIIISILLSTLTYAQKTLERPKLVVGIVVDQMRYDYLYRFHDNYSEGGFKRLMKQGTNFRKAYIPYIPTFTAVGHTCIYTGSVPALTGIIANDWIERNTNTKMYCTQDDNESTVGSSSDAGQMSPRNLIASTITDEYLLGTNFNSRAYGVSIKDRGAILPAGHLGKAFWFDGSDGSFVSSTYYMDELPTWVEEYNASNVVDKYYSLNWDLFLPEEKYTASRSDDSKYEGFHKDGLNTFPHDLTKYIGEDKGIIKATPYGNRMTLQFSKKLIAEENLGQDGHNDILAVSLSSTDYIGHIFGPQSLEVEDAYIRLDRDLADFFDYLDKTIGKDDYVVFLTADHGVAHNAGYADSIGLPAGYLWEQKEYDNLVALLKAKFGRSDFLLGFKNYSVHLDESKFGRLDEDAIYDYIIKHYQTAEDISFALNLHEPEEWILPVKLSEMVTNHIYRKRAGDILVIPAPQHYAAYLETGTTHGVWNPYDTHIPLLFMGKDIEPGEVTAEVYMTDIAPTLADILYLQEPNASIGKSLYMYLK